jgi:hypothetical protein
MIFSYLPYFAAIIFFIVTFILTTNPVMNYLLMCSYNELWTKYTIALIIGSMAFIAVAYVIRKEENYPQ